MFIICKYNLHSIFRHLCALLSSGIYFNIETDWSQKLSSSSSTHQSPDMAGEPRPTHDGVGSAALHSLPLNSPPPCIQCNSPVLRY